MHVQAYVVLLHSALLYFTQILRFLQIEAKVLQLAEGPDDV